MNDLRPKTRPVFMKGCPQISTALRRQKHRLNNLAAGRFIHSDLRERPRRLHSCHEMKDDDKSTPPTLKSEAEKGCKIPNSSSHFPNFKIQEITNSDNIFNIHHVFTVVNLHTAGRRCVKQPSFHTFV